MTLTANIFGMQEKYVPGAARSVQLADGNMHTLGAARFGQRCAIRAKLHTAGATPSYVRVICGDGGSLGNLSNNGGFIISSDDDPVELYSPGEGFAVSVQKLRAADPDVDVWLYSTDATGETAKFPPLKVNASEAISAPAQALVNVTKPSGTADNDLMICVVGVDSASVEPDLPVGWAWLGGTAAAARVIASANPTLRVAWKLAASEGANYDFGKAASSQTWAAAIIALRVQGADSEGDYGLTAFNSAVYGAKHGTSESLNIALWITECIRLDADTRFPPNTGSSPFLAIMVAGAYNSSTPGDPVAQMASYSNFVRNGGGDMAGNEMVAIGVVMVVSTAMQLAAVKPVAAASHYEYQAGSLVLISM